MLNGLVVEQQDERDDSLEVELGSARREDRAAQAKVHDLSEALIEIGGTLGLRRAVICA